MQSHDASDMLETISDPFVEKIMGWVEQFSEGKNPAGALAEDKVKEMYSIAYTLYQNQHYEDSAHFFRLIVLLSPLSAKYWKGFGACLQMLQNYDEALNCYACSQRLNEKNPDPYLYIHAADCYFYLNQVELGLINLNAAKALAEKTKDHRILSHTAFMRDLWTKRPKS